MLAPLRLAPLKVAIALAVTGNGFLEMTVASATLMPVRVACLRFAFVRLVAEQLTPHCARTDPLRFANERSTPERLAPAKLAPGQFVKFVGVGFETIVQPSMTVSAEAAVPDAVAKTGVTNATTITRAEPLARRSRPTITATPDLAPPDLLLNLVAPLAEAGNATEP